MRGVVMAHCQSHCGHPALLVVALRNLLNAPRRRLSLTKGMKYYFIADGSWIGDRGDFVLSIAPVSKGECPAAHMHSSAAGPGRASPPACHPRPTGSEPGTHHPSLPYMQATRSRTLCPWQSPQLLRTPPLA